MSRCETSFEDCVKELKASTGITDENVIGCYLCNFNDKYICSRFSESGCRRLEACMRLDKVKVGA